MFTLFFIEWKIQGLYSSKSVKSGKIILSLSSRREIEFQMVGIEKVKFVKKKVCEFTRNETLGGDWKTTMIMTKPYDIVDISKKLRKKNNHRRIAKH